jgi:sugar lactone lactonase YvrE
VPITDLVSRRTALKSIGVGALGLAGALGGTAAGVQQQGQPTTLSTIATFDPPQLPENIAVAGDWTHYLSMAASGEVWSLTPGDDASPSSIAALPRPEGAGLTTLGIATSGDGSAVFVCHNTGDPETNGVWRVPVDDGAEPSQLAAIDPEGTTLNGITGDAFDDGTLLVTDHTRGAIWRVSSEGEAEPWLVSPLLDPNPYEPVPVGVDGIAVGPDGDVWVDNLSFGSLVRIPVGGDGSAGEPSVVAYSDELFGADGMTVDSEGTIYVAVNQQNRVVRVEEQAGAEADQGVTVETIVGGEVLDSPADVHLGAGGDEGTLYLCNAAFASAGVEGEVANPSYMSVDLEAAGTPAGTATATEAGTATEETATGTADGTATAEAETDSPTGTPD